MQAMACRLTRVPSALHPAPLPLAPSFSGHDINDYEIGKRRGLPTINIMNKDATLNDKAGKYAGMDRFAARAALWADIEAEGLAIKKEQHTSR